MGIGDVLKGSKVPYYQGSIGVLGSSWDFVNT